MQTESTNRFRRRQRQYAAGFTLIEVAAIILIIAVLVSLLSAALNHTQLRALRLTCLDNTKQLQSAWSMYFLDDNEWLPLNQAAPVPAFRRIPAINLSTNSWATGNPLQDIGTQDIEAGSLYPYMKLAAAYHCPMDHSKVLDHPQIQRNRSYSMSAYLGGDVGEPRNTRVKMRADELVSPPPENVFVFIEEDDSTLWGPNFGVLPREKGAITSTWGSGSTPSSRHEQGCNLSFADGHVEYWRWSSLNQDSATTRSKLSSVHETTDVRRLQACVPQP